MLKVKVAVTEEGFDNEKNEFVEPVFFTVQLEHSLVSLSKWESKYEKPFLGQGEKSSDEMLDYIRMMALSELPESILLRMNKENVDSINAYINAKMTATTIKQLEHQRPSREVITAEIIYFWMVSLQIPFECQNWHFNRLLTLVQVCNEKNKPPKKVGRRTAAQQQRELNAARRQSMGTRG